MSSKKTSKKCSKGYIKRTGYTTKSGTKVKTKCIVSRSASGEKTSDKLKKYLRSKEKIHKKAREKFSKISGKKSSKKCGSKQIMREGFFIKSHESTSKNGKKIIVKAHWVGPGCIKSPTNKNSKGPKLITLLEKDILAPFGYANIESMKKLERLSALKKAIKSIKPLSIYRRLIAIATLNKNKNPKLHDILRNDAEWIKTQSEYIQDMAKNSKNNSKKTSKNNSKKTSKKIN